MRAFYEVDGEQLLPTELTRGPWDPGFQHAGPPAAVLGRALERRPSPLDGPPPEWLFGRITFEILRPVPIVALRATAEVVRPGRKVEFLTASLSTDEGEVMRAEAWRIAASEVELTPEARVRAPAPDGPERGRELPFFDTGESVGYHSAMEYRFLEGAFLERGPARVWMRPRHPIVAGESPTPLQRVLIAADTGNGVSATLDLGRHLFINVDLTVHLHRMPVGDWVLLDAVTAAEAEGVGLAESALADERGALGRALQTLLIAER